MELSHWDSSPEIRIKTESAEKNTKHLCYPWGSRTEWVGVGWGLWWGVWGAGGVWAGGVWGLGGGVDVTKNIPVTKHNHMSLNQLERTVMIT